MNKICTKCGVEKDESFFLRQKSGKLLSRCRTCLNAIGKEWREKNPERNLISQRKWRENNPEKSRQRRLIKTLKNYGLSELGYLELLKDQKGVCAICEKSCNMNTRLAIDHLHGSIPMIVRGLLCGNCNTGLGKFKDSSELMKRAVDYVENFQKTDQFFFVPHKIHCSEDTRIRGIS